VFRFRLLWMEFYVCGLWAFFHSLVISHLLHFASRNSTALWNFQRNRRMTEVSAIQLPWLD
jgi:hypothetical protein